MGDDVDDCASARSVSRSGSPSSSLLDAADDPLAVDAEARRARKEESKRKAPSPSPPSSPGLVGDFEVAEEAEVAPLKKRRRKGSSSGCSSSCASSPSSDKRKTNMSTGRRPRRQACERNGKTPRKVKTSKRDATAASPPQARKRVPSPPPREAPLPAADNDPLADFHASRPAVAGRQSLSPFVQGRSGEPRAAQKSPPPQNGPHTNAQRGAESVVGRCRRDRGETPSRRSSSRRGRGSPRRKRRQSGSRSRKARAASGQRQTRNDDDDDDDAAGCVSDATAVAPEDLHERIDAFVVEHKLDEKIRRIMKGMVVCDCIKVLEEEIDKQRVRNATAVIISRIRRVEADAGRPNAIRRYDRGDGVERGTLRQFQSPRRRPNLRGGGDRVSGDRGGCDRGGGGDRDHHAIGDGGDRGGGSDRGVQLRGRSEVQERKATRQVVVARSSRDEEETTPPWREKQRNNRAAGDFAARRKGGQGRRSRRGR